MTKLPTTNLQISCVYCALQGSATRGSITFTSIFNCDDINADSICSTFVPGTTPAARLANLQSEPYEMGHFRGYEYEWLCTVPAAAIVTLNGGSFSFCLCTHEYNVWDAYSTQAWITNVSPISGVGSDSVGYDVCPSRSAREGCIMIESNFGICEFVVCQSN